MYFRRSWTLSCIAIAIQDSKCDLKNISLHTFRDVIRLKNKEILHYANSSSRYKKKQKCSKRQIKTNSNLSWYYLYCLFNLLIFFECKFLEFMAKYSFFLYCLLFVGFCVLPGEAMGENICDCQLIDNWRVFRAGNLFHAESSRLSNEVNKIITAPAFRSAIFS